MTQLHQRPLKNNNKKIPLHPHKNSRVHQLTAEDGDQTSHRAGGSTQEQAEFPLLIAAKLELSVWASCRGWSSLCSHDMIIKRQLRGLGLCSRRWGKE